jgi:hypothetical protein
MDDVHEIKILLPSTLDDKDWGKDLWDFDRLLETSSPFKFASLIAKASFDITACGFPSAGGFHGYVQKWAPDETKFHAELWQ